MRRLFLNNDLSEGRYPVDGRPVSLNDIRQPLFCVGTETDHVAPWHSVYKLHDETVAEITFVLASGGHNAGIVCQPGHPHRHYRIGTRGFGNPSGPDAWAAGAPRRFLVAGIECLAVRAFRRASGAAGKGYPVLGDAPGAYVMQR